MEHKRRETFLIGWWVFKSCWNKCFMIFVNVVDINWLSWPLTFLISYCKKHSFHFFKATDQQTFVVNWTSLNNIVLTGGDQIFSNKEHPFELFRWNRAKFWKSPISEHIINKVSYFSPWCSILWQGTPPWSSGSALNHRSLPPVFETSMWAYLKVVSCLTSLYYLWRSINPFSLSCAQKWP